MLTTYKLTRFLFVITLLSTVFSSCKHTENEEKSEIVTENYSLMVPNDMERVYHINELAKVQFQKPEEDLYFIVLDEPKEGFKTAIRQKTHNATPDLMGYYKVITNHFDELFDDFKVSDFGNTKINSCNAIVFSMQGKDLQSGKKGFFRYAIIEDDKNYYQIMSWTNIHFKDKHIGKMQGIIKSFKSKNYSG